MNPSDFNFQIIHLTSVDSTNIYALELLQKENVQEGLVVYTDFQKRGKGQRSKKWESEKGKNLTFSLLLRPCIDVDSQFDLSKLLALSVKDYLDTLAVGKVEIKWPNDILINKEKVAGILIENVLKGKKVSATIMGVGLNVNQMQFNEYSRKATSLKLCSGNQFNIKEVLSLLLEQVKKRYLSLYKASSGLHQEYLDALYGYGIPQNFQDKEESFLGVILGVLPNGKLQLNKNGKLKTYDIKELTFLE